MGNVGRHVRSVGKAGEQLVKNVARNGAKPVKINVKSVVSSARNTERNVVKVARGGVKNVKPNVKKGARIDKSGG